MKVKKSDFKGKAFIDYLGDYLASYNRYLQVVMLILSTAKGNFLFLDIFMPKNNKNLSIISY